MQNLILHPTSSFDQNLSKNTRRYVENTNKKSSFSMIPIPKFILKNYLRGAPFLNFKSFWLDRTWWNGICIIFGRPILNWNFLYWFFFCCDDVPPSFYDFFRSELWELDLQFLPSSLIMSRAYSCVHSSHSMLKEINFILAHIPWMNESMILGDHSRL